MPISDNQIIEKNLGKIENGDYVIFPGATVAIKWVSQDIENVNILYEKTIGGNTTTMNIVQNIPSNNSIINSYNVYVPFSLAGNPNYEYPIYRVKIIDTLTNNVVAYSNPFKISVIVNEVPFELPK